MRHMQRFALLMLLGGGLLATACPTPLEEEPDADRRRARATQEQSGSCNRITCAAWCEDADRPLTDEEWALQLSTLPLGETDPTSVPADSIPRGRENGSPAS